MNLKTCAIYDSKAQFYAPPMFFKTKAEAIRSWADVVNDKQAQFFAHPEDYTLFEIGEFNNATGTIIPHEAKISLGLALEYIKGDNLLNM